MMAYITLSQCQKNDWYVRLIFLRSFMIKYIGLRKEHKHRCKGTLSGKPAMGRDPVMKVTEKFMDNAEIRGWVKSLLIAVLDLANHPENSTKYIVTILAGTSPASTNTGVTIPTQQRKKVPMLFHIVKAIRFPDDDVDPAFPGLKNIFKDSNRKLDEMFQGIERQSIAAVRAVWVSQENPSSVQMFCDYINRQEIAFVQGLHLTAEDIVRYFFPFIPLGILAEQNDSHINAQPKLHPDIKEMFTIVSPNGCLFDLS
jgi:hypothetical protein